MKIIKHKTCAVPRYGNNKTMGRKHKCFSVPVFLCLCVFMFLCFIVSLFAQAKLSPDAIAIRVIPNQNHYSAMRWYAEKGFSGSPQSLIIDGYEAVRDGRTVYVNAANVSSGGELYTNIYLISYNQNPEQATIDIFGQILEHWHFNTNLTSPGDCVQEYLNLGNACVVDTDCNADEYCSSDKAETTRDTRRLSDLAEMKIHLEDYKNKHNKYPSLESGSYIPYSTISTWPSWQGNLSKELGIAIPIDPIDKLGDCGDDRFNPETCWDEENKEFADSDLSDTSLNLPVGSNVYVYTSSGDGSSYEMCGVMESGLITTLDEGACAGSSESVIISDQALNSPPEFTGVNLPISYFGYEYAGYIQAVDPDGDSLTWSINTSGTTWTNWSAPPALENTPVENQKSVKADSAGNAGAYSFQVTVNDGRGGSATATYTIIIHSLCGDGVVQSPNDEYSGGPADDGYEQCDINDHVAQSPEESALNGWYYECTGICVVGQADCAGTCSWDGGYCGDGVVQDGYDEECDPNETKADYESRIGIAVDSATWTAIQNACDNCSMSCVDRDGDGYGYPTNLNCAYTELDCGDLLDGADGIPSTLDDGANINPGQPDDCTQYDGLDNDCDGSIDEHADTTAVLSNTDFETIDLVTGFPVDWYGAGCIWADVSVVTTEANSGTHSLLLQQDPNLTWPEYCSQDLCEGAGAYSAGDIYPYSSSCAWLSGTSQCDFADSAYCDWDGGLCIYNNGQAFDFFAYANRTMWLYFDYNVSSLGWEVGKMYIVKFYYKGHSSAGFNSYMTYSLGWHSMCNTITSNWGSLNCAEGALNSGTGYATCIDQSGYCCVNHPYQTKCYESLYMGSTSAGDYPVWTQHSTTFIYTDEMNSHLDSSGNLRNVIGGAMGYNSTDSLGTDLYIDDFQVLECNSIP